MSPLLLCTFFIYSLLNQGYERQIKNIPLEILSRVSKTVLGESNAINKNKRSDKVSSEKSPDKELDEIKSRLSESDNLNREAPTSSIAMTSSIPKPESLLDLYENFELEESAPYPIPNEESFLLDQPELFSLEHLEPTVYISNIR